MEQHLFLFFMNDNKKFIGTWIKNKTVISRGNKTMGCVCVEVLRPSQPNGVMSSAVSLPNHTFTGQA